MRLQSGADSLSQCPHTRFHADSAMKAPCSTSQHRSGHVKCHGASQCYQAEIPVWKGQQSLIPLDPAPSICGHMQAESNTLLELTEGCDRRHAVQVGCAMNCQFCLTGRMGLRGNLTTAQIVDQVTPPHLGPGCMVQMMMMISRRDAVLSHGGGMSKAA